MNTIYGVKGFISLASQPNSLVMLHRSVPRANGSTIDIPGGHREIVDLDDGIETEPDALVREVREETGLEVVYRSLQKIGHHSDRVTDGWLERGYYEGIAYAPSGEFTPDVTEIDDVFLRTPEDAVVMPGLEPLVRRALEDLIATR